MGHRLHDPKDSLKALEPPKLRLAFGMEVDFMAGLEKDVDSRMSHESVGHALLERLQQLHLRCISPQNQGHRIVLERADVDDPTLPPHLIRGEKQMLNLVCPAYYLDASYGWEDDMHQIFSCSPYKFNPLFATDLDMKWELDPGTSLTVYIEDRTHPNAGFPFHTARNLAMILLVFGPKIDSMIKSKIAQEIASETGVPWTGPRPIPDKYGNLPDNAGFRTPREWASYVLHKCSTIESLCETMPTVLSSLKAEFSQSFRVDFSALLTSPRKTTESTYRFRENSPDFPTQEYYSAQTRADRGPGIVFVHRPGTLDAVHIIHWIRFLGSLVEFANHIGLESLVLFLGLEENGYTYFKAADSSSVDDQDDDETDTETDAEYETETDTEFWDEPKPKDKRTLGERQSSKGEMHTEFRNGQISPSEINLRNWDNIRWHPTLCKNERTDPPNRRAEAMFQNLYPFRGLVAGMDMVGTGLEHDTTKFWAEGMRVKYNSTVESDSEPDLPGVQLELENEGGNDEATRGLEAIENLSMTQEPESDHDTSDPTWIPGAGSYFLSEDETLERKKRRCS